MREGDDSGTLYDSDGVHVIGSNALPLEQVARPGAGDPKPGETPFTAYSPDGTELFGVNEAGQRFGSREFADLYLSGKLDLVAAVGADHVSGYVKQSDLDGADVDSSVTELPVYASDGVTRVDTLRVSRGDELSEGAPTA